jgi:hypothetical protein
MERLEKQVNRAALAATKEVTLYEHHQSIVKEAERKKAELAAAPRPSQATKDALIDNMTVPSNLQEGGQPNKKAKVTTINQYFIVKDTELTGAHSSNE